MKDIMWFLLDGEILLILCDMRLHVYHTTKRQVILEQDYEFIAVSKDQQLVAVVDSKMQVSVWNVLNAQQEAISLGTPDRFSKNQRLYSRSRGGSQRDFRDIFTDKIAYAIKAPLIPNESGAIFGRWSFRLPEKPFLLQEVIYDSDWGETSYVWCFDLEQADWLFSCHSPKHMKFYSRLLNYSAAAVIPSDTSLVKFDLGVGHETGRLRITPFPIICTDHPIKPNSLFCVFANQIKEVDFVNNAVKDVLTITSEHGIVSLSVEPPGELIYTLICDDNKTSMCIYEIDSGQLVNQVMVGETP